MLTLELSLPIWQGSKDAAVRQAEAEQEAARMMHAELSNRLSADLNVALYHFEDAGRKLHLFRDTLVPKAEQALQTSEAAFVSGAAGYLDMLDTERQLLEFRLMAERAMADRATRLAELEMLCGRTLRKE
jgi:outer membrane protein TolC